MNISKKVYKNISDKIKSLPKSIKNALDKDKNSEKNIKNPFINKELLKSIHQTQKELEMATFNFEFAADIDLIDYYIYQMKACQAKYEYLIKKAKEKGITAENIPITNNSSIN